MNSSDVSSLRSELAELDAALIRLENNLSKLKKNAENDDLSHAQLQPVKSELTSHDANIQCVK